MDKERRRQGDDLIEDVRTAGVIGKYVTSAVSAVIIGLMLWVGSSVNNQGVALATLIERVANLQDKISSMPVAVTRVQVDERMKPVERDVERLTDRVNRIENDVYVTYPNPSKKVRE